MTFDDLGLDPEILRAISEAGYASPTPIQAQAIPPALEGRDVLGIAQTGTGKTASFTLPMIHRLSQGRAKARIARSLILTPTRELAAQVAENFEKYGQYKKLKMALLIGGVSFGDQNKALNDGVDVLIATPGRLLDHFERGKLLLTGVQVMVVDEADRMLDMGFIPDIERIFQLTPFTRQTLFFSATMPAEITRLTEQFLQNPVRIEVARQATTAETVTQYCVRVNADDPKVKRGALRSAIDHAAPKSAIIFCNRKRDVDVVARSLQRHDYAAAAIHGDLPQSVRTATLDRFRNGELRLLVASDVAARGLDIPDVGCVFNFSVPRHAEDYVHRIGRTGRAGRSGEAYTIVSPEDAKSFKAVIKLIDKDIPDAPFAAAPAAPAEAATEQVEKPARERGARSGRRGARSGERDQRSDRTPRKTAEDGPRAGGRDRPVVGLGDHTPAFLLRPVSTPDAASEDVDAPSPAPAGA